MGSLHLSFALSLIEVFQYLLFNWKCSYDCESPAVVKQGLYVLVMFFAIPNKFKVKVSPKITNVIFFSIEHCSNSRAAAGSVVRTPESPHTLATQFA